MTYYGSTLVHAAGSVRYSVGVQAFQLGLGPWSRCMPRKWKQKVQDATSAARTARLSELVVAIGLHGGSSGGDAAYMQSVTRAGQVGSWAKPVPAFGARVNSRRLRLGLLKGTAMMVGRRVPGSTEDNRRTVGANDLECLSCPGVSMWSWTAPSTSMALYGQQPVPRPQMQLGARSCGP